jgi:hypothetical protein
MLNDFEKSKSDNSLRTHFGAFADSKNLGYCYLFYEKNTPQEILRGNEYSLQIKWDTTKKGAYGGCWADLNHLNLESFNYLTFYVKGLKGGEKFKVGLRGKNDADSETKIPINDVLTKGVTTEWQKVVIPLKQFKDIQVWSDVNIFSISFEHAFESGKGAILIDEIAFEK